MATDTWFDPSGRAIKVMGEGVHTKTRYDRLGRAVRRFTLAKDNDASNTYADVYTSGQTDVAGDHVLVEDQTYFQDTTGNALMTVRITRLSTDTSTTGELENDSDMSFVDDSAVAGRYFITGMAYDSLDRQTYSVAVGESFSDWDRDTNLSTTSTDSNLVTHTKYYNNGSVNLVTDPRGKSTVYKDYDDAGRRLTVVANWVNGTPSGTTGDDDVTTRFEYSKGHQTKMWVDLDGDGTEDSDDQVTQYIYGVDKGASFPDSKIAHGGLLARVIYPPNDASGTQSATDRDVWFAYNAQGQELWRQDQTELEIQLDYDTGGRLTHRRVIDMDTAGDLDDTVRRISYTYTSRGQTETITQWDEEDPASGTDSELDQVKYTYDDWGNLTKLEQDHNGVVGAGGSTDDYEVGYAYGKTAHTDSRNMIRRTQEVLRYNATDEQTVDYDYGSGGFADKVSRVLNVKRSGTTVATYAYDGEAELRSTNLPVPNLKTAADTIDRFQRQTRSYWAFTGSGSSPDYFFDTTIAYDRNSNITSVQDSKQVNPSGVRVFDAKYTIDGLNRVTGAQEGHLSGGTITTESRDELWTLTQTGNWSLNRVDLNGDNDYIDTGELDDTRTHAPVNEILTRNTDSTGGAEFSLTYNLRGDLEDEGGAGGYGYVWDAFGRLIELRAHAGGGGALLAEYRYNGLNQRITWHYDATGNGTTDGSDPTYHFCYDDRWRMVGTWRGTDTDPKEAFTNHNAGLAGRGGSSYIDTVILRDRDINTAWTTASDGVLEARHYYSQNWRADVSGIFDNSGNLQEWSKYSAYGIPFLLTPGDYDKDGLIEKADETAFNTDYGTSNLRADMDEDGDVDSADQALFTASYNNNTSGGRYKLSSSLIGNRKGYAGYEAEGFGNDLAVDKIAHVRNRVLHFGLGRWTRRDPMGYVDGVNPVAYVQSNSVRNVDPMGLQVWSGLGCSSNPWSSWNGGIAPPGHIAIGSGTLPCSSGEQGGAQCLNSSWVYYGCLSMPNPGGGGTAPPPRPPPWCADWMYCFNLYDDLMQRAMNELTACALRTIGVVMSPNNIAVLVLCTGLCVFTGPYWPICLAACLGISEAILVGSALYEWSQCLAAFEAAKQSADVMYCACLAKRGATCPAGQRGESAYQGVNCLGLPSNRPGKPLLTPGPNVPEWPDGPAYEPGMTVNKCRGCR